MRLIALAAAVAVPLVVCGSAAADAISLQAPHLARYGTAVNVHGAVSPPAAGEPVQLVDPTGAAVAQITTDAAGRYAATLRATRGVTLSAHWRAVASAPVAVAVVPRLRVQIRAGAIFAPADITIRVAPSAGVRVRIVVLARGHRVAVRRAWVHGGLVRLAVPAEATRLTAYAATDALGGLAPAAAHTTTAVSIGALGPGSQGAAVAGLKRRLAALAFHQASLAPAWTPDTADAVLAFQKAFGLDRTGLADRATLVRLTTATPLQPRVRARDTHIEVDKTRQILMVVHDGTVTGVIPVSTGATGNTPVGHWHVLWKAPSTGTWLGSAILYRTLTFHGGFAIHGYYSVPSYPASHGCVREPMWAADWTYEQTPVGESVYVFA